MKICFFAILSFSMFAGYAVAQQTPQALADAELPSLLTIYKDIHSHPELSGREERTSVIITKELRAVGGEGAEHLGKYSRPEIKGYGVVGVMKNGPGPTVLVRTDMDALPVEEQTGLPYASTVTTKNDKGDEVHVMHAWGRAAPALPKLKDQWDGTILFVGQPAEEGLGGARALLADGLYTKFPKPDFALGFHDRAEMEIGHIGVTEGYTYANVDSVNITVRGVGGHGAYPHKTTDPVLLSAGTVVGLD